MLTVVASYSYIQLQMPECRAKLFEADRAGAYFVIEVDGKFIKDKFFGERVMVSDMDNATLIMFAGTIVSIARPNEIVHVVI